MDARAPATARGRLRTRPVVCRRRHRCRAPRRARRGRRPAGRLDLLVNNASDLGPSPLPALAAIRSTRCAGSTRPRVRAAGPDPAAGAPLRAAGGIIMNVSSDAAVEPYPGWGGYGSAKAALDQLSAVLAAEEPTFACTPSTPATCAPTCIRPPSPARTSATGPSRATVVPALLRLLDARPPSGRYRAADWAARCRRRSADDSPRSSSPPDSRPRRRRQTATACGCSSRAPAASSTPASPPSARSCAPGDLLVVNTSGTLAAAIDGTRRDGRAVTVHFATALDDGSWVVEVRPARGRRERCPTRRRASDRPARRRHHAAAGTRARQRCRAARRPDPAVAGRGRRGGRRRRPTWPGTAGRSATPTSRAVPAGGLPDGVRPRARQRGDAERRPAVHRASSSPTW